MPGGANYVSERFENVIFKNLYDRSKKGTFQSDSCLDSGFRQVCGGLNSITHSIRFQDVTSLHSCSEILDS